MKKYSFLRGLWKKGIVPAIAFSIPVLLMSNPAWADITIGGGLLMFVNWLKVSQLR